MIVDDDSVQSEVLGIDKDTTMKMTIDRSSDKILMMVLSQNLYSDGIGSLIREYTTNALDAQREAGNDEPIKVRLVRENGQFVFTVQDEGVGLSPDRIENVFSKYLSSTKRNDENQMGWYGLGSKSALAYVDSFHIISRFDGKEYDFLMLKGTEGTELSLMDINDTTERNGVQIKVYLNDDDDYETFLEKMRRQLCYFEGVFIETEYDDIEPDYKIIKTADWKFSELNQDQFMHLSLDNVYYPLDFEKLGIEPIRMPIGITLSLKDKIIPTPNRENILYNAQTKQLIIDKIKSIGQYFVSKWNENAPNINTLDEANDYRNNYGKVTLYKEEILGETKEITVKVDKALAKLIGVELKSVSLALFPNLSVEKLNKQYHWLLQEYKTYGSLKNGYYQTKFGNNSFGEDISASELINEYYKALLLEPGEALTNDQIKYLRWSGETIKVIRRHTTTKLGKYSKYGFHDGDTYRGILDLDKKPKDEWRTIIKEYQAFVKQYTDMFMHLSDIVPTQEYEDWKEENKRERKKARYNTREEITIGRLRTAAKGKNRYIPEKETHMLSDLHKMQGVFVFTHEDNIDELDEFYNLNKNVFHRSYSKKKKLKGGKSTEVHYSYGLCTPITLSDRNFEKLNKYIQNNTLHNWIPIEEFWNRKHKVLSEYLTRSLLNRAQSLLGRKYTNDDIKIIDSKYFNSAKDVESYVSQYNRYDNYFEESKLQEYHAKRWLNYPMIQQFISVLGEQNRYNFLKLLNISSTRQKEIKPIAYYLYLKQIKKEKATGLCPYERLDVQGAINEILRAKYIEGPKDEEVESIDEEEIIISDVVPDIEPLEIILE